MATIQWFPGHMSKARRQVQESIKFVDFVTVLVDARLPLSSQNPMLTKIVGEKPKLLVLNKADLADPVRLKEWQTYFEGQGIPTLALNSKEQSAVKKVTDAAKKLMADKLARQKDRGIRIETLRTMIIGIPNAGKSTLINLLMRFYPINSGDILLDGRSIYDYSRASLRQQFGMVLQETWLKQGTIHDNIAFGNPEASREQVIAAAKAANADFFIQQLPQGYDTKLENAGESLSVGQAQLLTIARVFLAIPKILILDEATSSIDTRTEVLVQDAFAKLMKGRTSFIIAHRLSTIQDADLILVLVDGDIVEHGNHHDLMARKGKYYQMQKAAAFSSE